MTSFYINKHVFSNTLYYKVQGNTFDTNDEGLNGRVEGAGVKSYGKYNLIGRFKVARGQAFEQTFHIKDKEGNEKTVVQIIDAKSLADYKMAELKVKRELRRNHEINPRSIMHARRNQKKPENKTKYEAQLNKLYDLITHQIKFWKKSPDPEDRNLEYLDRELTETWNKLNLEKTE